MCIRDRSIRFQLLANTIGICDVPPQCFKPSPKVDSKVVVIEPFTLNERHDLIIEKKVNVLLKSAFLGRRKKLKNTLVAIKPLSELEMLAKAVGINLDQRPQELSPIMWVNLAKTMEEKA